MLKLVPREDFELARARRPPLWSGPPITITRVRGSSKNMKLKVCGLFNSRMSTWTNPRPLMLILGSSYSKKTSTCYNEMKLILKSRKPNRLKGLKVHHDGIKPTNSLGCWSVVAFVRLGAMLRAGSHGVPSPTNISKSQHGGKVPTLEPWETIENTVRYH